MPTNDARRPADTEPVLSNAMRTHEIEPSQRPSDAVVMAVAAESGRDPLELPPLCEAIDPEALDALVDRDGGRGDPAVATTYADYHVRVDRERVHLRPR